MEAIEPRMYADRVVLRAQVARGFVGGTVRLQRRYSQLRDPHVDDGRNLDHHWREGPDGETGVSIRS